jgi:hypothetical protein
MNNLPIELLVRFSVYMNDFDIISLSKSCKYLYQCMNSEYFVNSINYSSNNTLSPLTQKLFIPVHKQYSIQNAHLVHWRGKIVGYVFLRELNNLFNQLNKILKCITNDLAVTMFLDDNRKILITSHQSDYNPNRKIRVKLDNNRTKSLKRGVNVNTVTIFKLLNLQRNTVIRYLELNDIDETFKVDCLNIDQKRLQRKLDKRCETGVLLAVIENISKQRKWIVLEVIDILTGESDIIRAPHEQIAIAAQRGGWINKADDFQLYEHDNGMRGKLVRIINDNSSSIEIEVIIR